MKKTLTAKFRTTMSDDMLPEYKFDYRKARPNRFAERIYQNQRVVMLDQDIAKVFTTSESVNNVLRALIMTMPASDRVKNSRKSLSR